MCTLLSSSSAILILTQSSTREKPYPAMVSGIVCLNFGAPGEEDCFQNGTYSVIIGKLIFLINFSLPGLSFAKSIMSDDESNIFKAEEAIKFLENGGKRMSNISFLLVCNLKC